MLRPVTGAKKKRKKKIEKFENSIYSNFRDNRSQDIAWRRVNYELRYDDNVNNDRNNFANRFLIITFYYLSLGLVTKLERNFLFVTFFYFFSSFFFSFFSSTLKPIIRIVIIVTLSVPQLRRGWKFCWTTRHVWQIVTGSSCTSTNRPYAAHRTVQRRTVTRDVGMSVSIL